MNLMIDQVDKNQYESIMSLYENVTGEQFGRVVVLCGGAGTEREISLISGDAVYRALCEANIDAHKLICGQDDKQLVPEPIIKGEFDRVFIMVHGLGGEDGQIQAVLDKHNIPYTGSGLETMSLTWNKVKTKQLWQQHNLPTPTMQVLDKSYSKAAFQAKAQEIIDVLGLPVMVKPSQEGSSYGATLVRDMAVLYEAWHTAYQYHSEVLIESYIEGKEYTVSILADHALPIIKIETPRIFYDYVAKYEDDNTRYICPAGLSWEEESEIVKIALAANRLLKVCGYSRVDLMADEDGKAWLIELNTVPGMTDHSLVPMAAKHIGMDFNSLVQKILATSMVNTQ